MTDYAKRLDTIRDKWMWMPGMVDADGYRVYELCTIAGSDEVRIIKNGRIGLMIGSEIPDITDPATKGCLLQQIMEADERFEISLCASSMAKLCRVYLDGEYLYFDSYEDGLMAALEAM
jgi:hypothetical protein